MRFLHVAIVLAVTLPAWAAAEPMTAYRQVASEHDALGSSGEPDRVCTTVLKPVNPCNRVLDTNGDLKSEPDAGFPGGRVLAPGCTSDAGRQEDGSCGLWTIGAPGVPPHALGTAGGPGPGLGGRTLAVSFLDARIDVQAPVAGTVDFKAKLKALGVKLPAGTPFPAALQSVGVGPSSVWAWHGTWRDLNGNGVIDSLPSGSQGAAPDNEFLWLGRCGASAGTPVGEPACRAVPIPGYRMIGWAYPGGHNAGPTPDAPGLQGVCLGVGTPAEQCAARQGDTQGDTLLERPTLTNPDWTFLDWTGDPNPEKRGWFVTGHHPVYHYDHGTITTYITVVVAGPPGNSPTGNFVDVDLYPSLDPNLEAILNGQVKPAARSTWCALPGSYSTPKC